MNNYQFPKENRISDLLIEKAKYLLEFRNGATQVTVLLKSGKIYEEVLLSNSSVIIAVNGYTSIPFSVNEIENIYQQTKDINPNGNNHWFYFQ